MKRCLYRLLSLLFLSAIFIPIWNISAKAETVSESTDTAEIIDSLYHETGADELIYHVPDESREFLRRISFIDFKPGGTDNISLKNLLEGIGCILTMNLTEPIRILICIIGIVLITAMFDTLKSSSLSGSLSSALTVVSSLCMVSVIAPPMLSLIDALSQTIIHAGNFMLVYIPVISALIISSGQPVSGSMYYGIMIYVSSAILQIESKIIIPLLKYILSMSIVISVSSTVSLDGIINLFKKAIRWILTFCMSLFVAFMTMKSIVAVSEDSISNKAVKFAISNFVPLVGGALSDAFQTVVSCVSVLKSGVGVAAMAAVFAIFLPAVAKCMIWQTVIAVCIAVCDIFGISKSGTLLNALGATVSTICAILLCTMVIYIISTAIIIIVGG